MKKNLLLILVLVLAFSIIVILGVTVIPTSAEAIDKPMRISFEEAAYDSYEIQENDTLWSIAEKYAPAFGCSTAEYLEALKQVNHTENELIRPKQHIIVLYVSGT